MNNQSLKHVVHDYWDKASCGTWLTNKEKFSRAYFDEIEATRYQYEPEIFSFAQFTRFRDKKILEVGVGAGTDFLQWVRAGGICYGVDLTQEAVDNVTHRLAVYNLQASQVCVADAESLPYQDNQFDLVYSWGVIHHSPDTEKCLQEIIRVTKPGGIIKIMIYNRYSLFALYRYLLSALFKGKPFQSLSTVIYNHQESLGTKAYTFKEVKKMLHRHPIAIRQLKATVNQHDLLYYKSAPYKFAAYCVASLFGWNRVGWFMTIELEKQ